MKCKCQQVGVKFAGFCCDGCLKSQYVFNTAGAVSSRVLKFLIPASVVPQETVVRGFSWLCVQKLPQSTQVNKKLHCFRLAKLDSGKL